jgi:hypothetical protein
VSPCYKLSLKGNAGFFYSTQSGPVNGKIRDLLKILDILYFNRYDYTIFVRLIALRSLMKLEIRNKGLRKKRNWNWGFGHAPSIDDRWKWASSKNEENLKCCRWNAQCINFNNICEIIQASDGFSRHLETYYGLIRWLKQLRRVDLYYKKTFFYKSGIPTLEKWGNLHMRGRLSSKDSLNTLLGYDSVWHSKHCWKNLPRVWTIF